jgi:branched-chain amino acid aminotransferase
VTRIDPMSNVEIRIEPAPERLPGALPEELGFGRIFTGRMFTQRYTAEQGWHDAVIGPYRPLSMDPAALPFHCGQMVFDGTKAYQRPDGEVNLFRVERNAERFNRSAERLAMPPVNEAFHVAAIERLVALERGWVPQQPGSALYIRPVMIATDASLLVRASRGYLHYIVLSPVSPYFAGGFRPVSVSISDEYVRATRGGTGEAKTPANYAVSLYPTEQAIARGYDQVLWLDATERRYVEEAGAMNIAFVYEGRHIRTPALSGSILHGITRDSILRLAPDLGFQASEERIDVREMLRDVDRGVITEVFNMGTGAVLVPVGRLGYRGRDYLVNGGQPGPVAQRLYRGLTDIQYGRVADPYGWTRVVSLRAPVLSETLG